MTNLHDLFDEATAAPPPSRLSIEDIYAATRSRRRRRWVQAFLAAISTVAVTATGALFVTAKFAAPPPPQLVTGPPAVAWSARGDATNLYLMANVCDRGPSNAPDPAPFQPDPRCQELLASSDGGATWVSRGSIVTPPRVLGPRTLMRWAGSTGTPPPTTDPALDFELSTDGGATWNRLPVQGPPIDAVPAGGTIIEGFGTDLTVYDPGPGRLRKLAAQPNLRRTFGEMVITGPQDIWLSGLSLTTLRPAVAVSHDSGRSWTERDLPGTAVVPQPTLPNGAIDPNQADGHPLNLITGDGTTAYVTTWDGSPAPAYSSAIPGAHFAWLRTYRTTDGGLTWQVTSSESTTPGYSSTWMTADGRIVTALPGESPDGITPFTYAVSADGLTFNPATLPGLPEALRFIDGQTAHNDHAMYATDDGFNWREVWRR